MQSATSDVNAGVLEYRRMLVFAIDRQNIINALTAIFALNGILPPELKLRFNDEEYRRQTTDQYLATCPACKTEVPVTEDVIRIRLKSAGMGAWNSVDPNLVSRERYMVCPELKAGGATCGTAIPIRYDDLTIVTPTDAADAAANAAAGTNEALPAPVVFAPTLPSIQNINDQMLMAPEFWARVRAIAALLENQLREFRVSVSVQSDDGEEAGL